LSKIDNGDRDRGDEATGDPWPSVLSYWRTISAEAFNDATKAEVITFVRATTSTIPEWQRAISGDAEAAIGMVMHCKASTSIGIKVDLPTTSRAETSIRSTAQLTCCLGDCPVL
jgi:hypothetical protein